MSGHFRKNFCNGSKSERINLSNSVIMTWYYAMLDYKNCVSNLHYIIAKNGNFDVWIKVAKIYPWLCCARNQFPRKFTYKMYTILPKYSDSINKSIFAAMSFGSNDGDLISISQISLSTISELNSPLKYSLPNKEIMSYGACLQMKKK